jgi:hypothetical protein
MAHWLAATVHVARQPGGSRACPRRRIAAQIADAARPAILGALAARQLTSPGTKMQSDRGFERELEAESSGQLRA